MRPLGRDKGGIGRPRDAAVEDGGGGEGNPRSRENSELARECLEFWLRGRTGSGGASRLADDVARLRVPGASANAELIAGDEVSQLISCYGGEREIYIYIYVKS